MLKLRSATVLDAEAPSGSEQAVTIELTDAPGERRAAIADVGLVGAAEPGDRLIVNVEAQDLGLGSGGFDLVHANLTRGLAAPGGGSGRT